MTESVTMTSTRGDFVEQRIMTRAQAIGAEITAHTVAKRTSLSDVNRFTRAVDPQIHAWLLGQAAKLILEVMNGHGLP